MKIIFQLIATLIILALSRWLFILIPLPSDMIPHYGVLGLFVYPFALVFYVTLVGVLGLSAWKIIALIFKDDDDEEDEEEDE